MLVQLFPWQFPQVVTKSKPFLRQGQLLAPHEVFVECLQLHLSKFNSSAGPGSKIVYIASKLPLQFFHPQSVGEKSVWSSFFYLRIWHVLVNCDVQQLIRLEVTFPVLFESLMKNTIHLATIFHTAILVGQNTLFLSMCIFTTCFGR